MPEQDRLRVKHSGKSEKCWKALELVQTAEKYTASVDQQHKTQTSKQKKKKKNKKTIDKLQNLLYNPHAYKTLQHPKPTTSSPLERTGPKLHFRSSPENVFYCSSDVFVCLKPGNSFKGQENESKLKEGFRERGHAMLTLINLLNKAC